MERRSKIGRLLQGVIDEKATAGIKIVFPGEEPVMSGPRPPACAVICKNQDGVDALESLDERRITAAYVHSDIDIEGDFLTLFQHRQFLTDSHPILKFLLVRVLPLLRGQIKSDKKAIADHYDHDQGFYHHFLDKEWRAYSQGVFTSPEETLEKAVERKLSFAIDSLQLDEGARILDLGGGWGAFLKFAGLRGFDVTSLTISAESEQQLLGLVKNREINGRVLRQHFFEHAPEEPYDGIVNLGVTEHLPDYRRTIKKYAQLLKPGGRVYLDASACRRKHTFSSFITESIYPGNPTPLFLPEYIEEVNRSPFDVLELHNDRESYALTATCWARNLEAAREQIVDRVGVELFRKFQLYLWGTAHVFNESIMSAYRIVLGLENGQSAPPATSRR